MSRIKDLVSDEELKTQFLGTHYSNRDPRDIIRLGLLKVACKYHNGGTTKTILRNLKLIKKKKLKLTKKGMQYLYDVVKYESVK